MDIKELYNQREALEKLVNTAGDRLKSYKTYTNGIVINRDNPSYIHDYDNAEKAFNMLQAFNKTLTKKQKIEMRNYRRKLKWGLK